MKTRKKDSYFIQSFEKFREHKLAMAGLFVCGIEILLVIFLPMILSLDPYSIDAAAFGTAPGLGGHLLGTDTIGRDVFARLIYGGRVSLFVGFFSTVVSIVIGVPIGLLAGYLRGKTEMLIMRLTDIFMSFPSIVLILVAVAVVGPSLWSVTLIIGILGWTQFTRIVYSKVLSVSQQDYVEAARTVGANTFTIIWKEILPNSMPPVLISATFGMSSAILMESALSFLGMGVQPPTASWGNMIYDAQSISILATKPWMWMPAGIAIVITVLSINFLGDGIRDALDPKVNA
jgi:peptide/nickel transport system permease protein